MAAIAIVSFTSVVYAKPLMFMPFAEGEEWVCVQGNNSNYSHNGKLKYAYDFVKPNSWETFGQQVHSPISGTVVEKRDGAPDNELNDVKVEENHWGWGNTLLIRDDTTGRYVRLCHFKEGSIKVNDGFHVEMGQELGQVGNSGWSTGPHLHVHLQAEAASTATSIPFEFVEGPIEKDVIANSELNLYKRTSVIEESSNMSLSHELAYYKGWKSSSWKVSSDDEPNQITGQRRFYTKYKTKRPWYMWKFRMSKAGFFVIYAKYKGTSQKDPKALYSLRSEPNSFTPKYLYKSQQENTNDNWHALTFVYLWSGPTFYLKLYGKTKNKYLSADSIKFKRIW
ncbi:M23 family metallopeptidase [Candidatus Peregrinibacteria bacterium]|nr:M23 family metallopeptidase [Candidatus Peregrinibacteria bacterium]